VWFTKEMALEMFKPFVLREVIIRGYAPNIKSAKRFIEKEVLRFLIFWKK